MKISHIEPPVRAHECLKSRSRERPQRHDVNLGKQTTVAHGREEWAELETMSDLRPVRTPFYFQFFNLFVFLPDKLYRILSKISTRLCSKPTKFKSSISLF